MAKAFLRLEHISKNFSGVKALKDVSLTLHRGEVNCLVGENGSGKSTLIKIIAGVHPADSGTITINERVYSSLRPIDAIREGIQVMYQDFSLFPNLTVAENIALNYELSRDKRLVNWREVQRIAREALASIGVELPLNALVEQLSVANKQLIAISRALLHNARLIIMDEPTTALTEKEVQALFSIIGTLKDKGISILFVSHKLGEVREIAERVIVLRNGVKVVDAAADEMDEKKIVYYMTGQEFETAPYEYVPDPTQTTPLLKVDRLGLAGAFQDISFEVHPGEIVGITGLLGSGRTELALALFGLQPADTGQIELNGRPVKLRRIQDAIRHGIGYVPEDRLTEGLFLDRSIGSNMVVRTLRETLGRFGLIRMPVLKNQIASWVQNLHIKTNDTELPVRSLSGGNQQRVVLAKWLAASPRVLILNGPTVGVDIGSKTELHGIIKTLAREGMGIIVISDDIPELLHICSRILLMSGGRLVEQFSARAVTEHELSAKLRAEIVTA